MTLIIDLESLRSIDRQSILMPLSVRTSSLQTLRVFKCAIAHSRLSSLQTISIFVDILCSKKCQGAYAALLAHVETRVPGAKKQRTAGLVTCLVRLAGQLPLMVSSESFPAWLSAPYCPPDDLQWMTSCSSSVGFRGKLNFESESVKMSPQHALVVV